MTHPEIKLHVYRDLKNQSEGEPDDGAMAWAAHRARLALLTEALDDPAYDVLDWGAAIDRRRTHEFAELAVGVVSDPATQAALAGAAAYVGGIVAREIDKRVGAAVGAVFDRLLAGFRKKRIGDFWITLPDGSRIQVHPDAEVVITLRDGRMEAFRADAPPKAGAPADG